MNSLLGLKSWELKPMSLEWSLPVGDAAETYPSSEPNGDGMQMTLPLLDSIFSNSLKQTLKTSVLAGKMLVSWWKTPREVYSRSWLVSIVIFSWTGKTSTKAASWKSIAWAPDEVKVNLCLPVSDPPNSLSVAPNSLLEAPGQGGRRLLGHQSTSNESLQLRFRGS